MGLKKRRFIAVVFLLACLAGGYIYESIDSRPPVIKETVSAPEVLGTAQNTPLGPTAAESYNTPIAADALNTLEVKGRAPKTGYKRAQFGEGWANAGLCDVRNFILKRDMTNVVTRSDSDCTVLSGTLQDPYTGKTIQFQRGEQTSDDVQIDHVVALSDAWQKGAQALSPEDRMRLANDALNLLAVDGASNQAKSDADAATWLPSNKDYRCRFVARQIAVKQKYKLWVTQAEKDAMNRVLSTCPSQQLPAVST